MCIAKTGLLRINYSVMCEEFYKHEEYEYYKNVVHENDRK